LQYASLIESNAPRRFGIDWDCLLPALGLFSAEPDQPFEPEGPHTPCGECGRNAAYQIKHQGEQRLAGAYDLTYQEEGSLQSQLTAANPKAPSGTKQMLGA